MRGGIVGYAEPQERRCTDNAFWRRTEISELQEDKMGKEIPIMPTVALILLIVGIVLLMALPFLRDLR